MDPVTTTLLTAFIIGASRAVDAVGEQVVADAYDGMKTLVSDAYSSATDLLASITGLEKRPESEGQRTLLAEHLVATGATENLQLIAAAEQVIRLAEEAGGHRSIGVDWENVTAARLKVNKIIAKEGATGFRARGVTISGDVEFGEIDAGGSSGK